MAYRPKERIWTPVALPSSAVALADLKLHLRVDHTDDDALVGAVSAAATESVERWTQRLLVRRAATLQLPALPYGMCPVELPGGVVASVESVTADGAAVTGAAAYGHSPALLVPGADWPVVTGTGYPVEVSYTVGFAAAPADLVAAVKLIAADLYDRRGQSASMQVYTVPISAEWLMLPHRISPI